MIGNLPVAHSGLVSTPRCPMHRKYDVWSDAAVDPERNPTSDWKSRIIDYLLTFACSKSLASLQSASYLSSIIGPCTP